MAASEAISTFGTLIQMGDGEVSESFTTVAEVRDITGPTRTRTTQETTHHESPDAHREYIGTLADMGEPSFEVNWLAADATHIAVETAFADATVDNWQIVFPDDTGYVVAAIVIGLAFGAPVDGVRRATLTLRITGSPTAYSA